MGPGHGERISRDQEAAIAALLTSRSIRKAAAKSGIAERTLREWLKLPDFLTAYRAARRAIVETVIGRVQAASVRAVATLERNLKAPRPGYQVRAASKLLDISVSAVAIADVLTRVEELEKRLKEKPHAYQRAAQ